MTMIARRVAWAVLVVWFVVTATFLLVAALPTDPRLALLGPNAPAAAYERVAGLYCLEQDWLTRYGCWLETIASGSLGESIRTRQPVTEILADAAWPTIELALAALVLQIFIGIPLGIAAAVRRGRWPDRVTSAITLLGQSTPPFLIGTVLIYVVAYRWELLPFSGHGDGGLDRLRHLVMPALTLACFGVAYYARITRNELLEVLGEDHVRTARAKGLSEPSVVLRHALRPAAAPLAHLVGVHLGMLLGGAVVVETVFSWPGLGRVLLEAIHHADLPVIVGGVIVSAIAVAIANLVADLIGIWLDPRRRE